MKSLIIVSFMAAEGRAADLQPQLANRSAIERAFEVERRELRAEKSRRNRVVVSQKAK